MPSTATPAQRAVEDDELLVLNKQENVLGSLFTIHSLLLVPRAPPIQRHDDDALTGEPDSGPDDGEPESEPDDGESAVVVRRPLGARQTLGTARAALEEPRAATAASPTDDCPVGGPVVGRAVLSQDARRAARAAALEEPRAGGGVGGSPLTRRRGSP